jgi:ABC-type branched-subunit amino acid transport system ATPase component
MNEVSAAFGLFGREDSLRVVDEILVSGGSVVTTGDPGAGKSSLLRAAAQLAKARGRRVFSVTPTQFDRGLPFAGLAELIGQFPEGAASVLPARSAVPWPLPCSGLNPTGMRSMPWPCRWRSGDC